MVKEKGSACQEKVQCSELGSSFDCVEDKCTSQKTMEKEGDIQEGSGK